MRLSRIPAATKVAPLRVLVLHFSRRKLPATIASIPEE